MGWVIRASTYVLYALEVIFVTGLPAMDFDGQALRRWQVPQEETCRLSNGSRLA